MATTNYDERTALLVIDVQNDFAHPEGSLYVRGGDQIIPRINEEIARAREAGALVVYTQDWHPESTPHFEKDGGVWPVHCVMDSWGAGFYDDLEVIPDAPVVRKGSGGEDGYSGFTVRDPETGEEDPTQLDRVLQERNIERVVVIGLAQDYCVKETALDAVQNAYKTEALSDATRPVDMEPGDGERAFEELQNAGAEIR